jgi:hypothetical protein
VKRLLLSAALLAAFVPGTADATGARFCEPGYVGVIVYDAAGDIARVCVRDPGIDPEEIVSPWGEYLGDVVDWADRELPPRCWYYPQTHEIESDNVDGPPRPPLD